MDPILFYGVPEGCSFGSIVALEWLGKPYRLCRIAMPEVVSSEAYRRINPLGETPAFLTADRRVLSQSLAILNHIDASAGKDAPGADCDNVGIDRRNEMLAFLNTTFFEAFTPLWHVMEHGSTGSEAEVLRAYGRAKVAKAHDQLEAMLGDGGWLLGERGPADAYFAGLARWVDVHQAGDRASWPALDRLYRRLQDDPGVRFAHDIEHGVAVRGTGGFGGHVSLEEALEQLRPRA